MSRGAQLSLRIGRAVEVDAAIDAAGLLAIGALVTGALLGSAAILLAARTRRPAPPKLLPYDG